MNWQRILLAKFILSKISGGWSLKKFFYKIGVIAGIMTKNEETIKCDNEELQPKKIKNSQYDN